MAPLDQLPWHGKINFRLWNKPELVVPKYWSSETHSHTSLFYSRLLAFADVKQDILNEIKRINKDDFIHGLHEMDKCKTLEKQVASTPHHL